MYNKLIKLTIISIVLTGLFFSCSKKGVNDFSIHFVDANGSITSNTSFETRPYITWKTVCSDIYSDDIDRLSGFAQDDIRYNWFSITPVISNDSSHDIVLNKVSVTTSFLGNNSGNNIKSYEANNECILIGSESCQFCFPRTIPAGTQSNMAVNPSGSCLFHSGDDKSYKAARVIFTIEAVSEKNGTITKTMDMFATPRDDYNPSFTYGTLLNSDGEGVCRSNWTWGIWESSNDPGEGSVECCSLDE